MIEKVLIKTADNLLPTAGKVGKIVETDLLGKIKFAPNKSDSFVGEISELFENYMGTIKNKNWDRPLTVKLIEKLADRFRCLISQGIEDPVIKEAIINKVKQLDNISSPVQARKKIQELVRLSAVDNSVQNKSYFLKGNNYQYTKLALSQKNNGKHKQILDEITQALDKQNSLSGEALLFKNQIELDALKTYLKEYSQSDPQLTKYLYEKYYLSRLSDDTKTVCRKISDEFNTKLFVEDETSPKAAQAVYDELFEWKEASNGGLSAPLIIDCSKYDKDYIRIIYAGGGM